MNRLFQISGKFVVHQGEEPSLFPGLARAANGDLLVSFCTRFDCLAGGEAYLLRSSDSGRTWSEPGLLAQRGQGHLSEKCDNSDCWFSDERGRKRGQFN